MILNPWSSDIVLDILLPVYSWILFPYALTFGYKMYKISSKKPHDYDRLVRCSISWIVPAVSIFLALASYWYIYFALLGLLYFTFLKDIKRLRLTNETKKHNNLITLVSVIFTIFIIFLFNVVFGIKYNFFPQ
jgi:hypothetical protein